ncbi:hypothetical protein [Bradyrhizobium sp. 5.13L]
MDKLTLKYVWGQERIPVVLRRTGKGQRLRVRIPFAETNRQWLQNGRRTPPVWTNGEKYWELPKAWFNDFVERAPAKYGKIYVIQPYREQEKCSPATRTRSVMSANVPAWASITVPEMTAVGSRFPTPLRRVGPIRSSPADS